jgi:hypothetical protein
MYDEDNKRREQMTNTATYTILSSESAKDMGYPFIVFVKRNGREERATHLGNKARFKSLYEAQDAIYNAEQYGTQKV